VKSLIQKPLNQLNLQMNLNNVNNKSRSAIQILNSIETSEGKGFIVHRVSISKTILHLDPFLLLDEVGA
jgi:hypothetical protein